MALSLKTEKLRFKSCYRVEVLPPDQVILLDDLGGRQLLTGSIYAKLAPYLCSRTGRLPQKFLIDPECVYALFRLQEKGFVEENKDFLPKPIGAFCHLLGLHPEQAVQQLQKQTVSVYAFGKCSAKKLTKALGSLGIRTASDGNFAVVVTDNYRKRELKELGERFYRENTPWILLKPVGAEVWMGPLFIPGKTGCFACLFEQLTRNETEDLYIEQKKKSPITVNLAQIPTIEPIATNLIAGEIFKWIVKQESSLEGNITSFNAATSSWINHTLNKRQECSLCGTPLRQVQQPIVLQSCYKRFKQDGGHRGASPEETVKKYAHLISPITGIVGHLTPAPLEGNPHAHVYFAGHSMDACNFLSRPYFKSRRTASGGKGNGDAQAKASCLCEAIERFSGVFQSHEERQVFAYTEIQKEAIHPNSLTLFSKKQYRVREDRDTHSFQFVPFSFQENQKIEWSPVWSLSEKRFKWAPTAFCYYHYPFSKEGDTFCRGDSNGCAAGNTLEEAILQGFFELVERDSVAIWWYCRLSRPGVDLESFASDYIRKQLQHHQTSSRKLLALDLTMDLGIPVFAALSYSVSTEKEICFGFGAHLDPKIALERAISEMYQAELLLRKDMESANKPLSDWLNNVRLSEHPYLQPNPRLPLKREQDYLFVETEDLKDDILKCQQIVEAKGLEMLVLDQTRTETGLPVVRVIVPGLRHFWRRLAPGRLYDVPLQLGLLKTPLQEEELNPISMFI